MNTPKFGIVRWRDAAGMTGKIKPGRLAKSMPVKETIGWLFQDKDGTLAVVQERIIGTRGVERYGEFTLVPASWVVEIIPLEIMVPVSPVEGVPGCDPSSKGSNP